MGEGKISVVLPAHNEQQNVQYIYDEIVQVLKEEKRGFEIVFVDDGSTDDSFSILRQLCKQDPRVKVLRLRGKNGQTVAISAGIDVATGVFVVTMDADLQHDPRFIIPMINKLEDGFDVVCGWRRNRGVGAFLGKSIPSKISNVLVRLITGLPLHDTVGGMKAFKRTVAEDVVLYGDMHRYFAALAYWRGFRVTEVPIYIRKRRSGKTHYTVWRLFTGFLDLLTVKFFVSYAKRPIHFFGAAGIICSGVGVAVGVILLLLRIFMGTHLTPYSPLLLFAVALVLLGFNFLFFGLLADMVSHQFIIANHATRYTITESLNVKWRG